MLNFDTLADALEQNNRSDRTVTYIEGKDVEKVVSYQQLHQRALGMLFHLQQRGLQAGDELIVLTRNNEKFIDAYWGAIFGGVVPVPVAVGISDEHRSKLYRIFSKLKNPYVYTDTDNLDRLKTFAHDNNRIDEFTHLRQRTLLIEEISDLDNKGSRHQSRPDDVAFIQFSSGSTSDPKGVVLTHRNITTNINAITIAANQTEDDISLSWMPLTHDMGLIGFHLNMIACNISQCLIPTDLFSRRPLLWLQKASEKKATVLCSPNFGYKHFLKALGSKKLENVDLSNVRMCYNGAEPISVNLIEQFLSTTAEYGFKREAMFTVYGLAEATLAVAFPEPGVSYRAVHVDRHKLRVDDEVSFVNADHADAVSFAVEGKMVMDVEVKITDRNNKTLPDNHIGDIQIKGLSVTQGYYLNEEANHAAFTGDGWLNVGDQGFLNNSELVITGRTKEIIFANGQNYYPHDIEHIALHSDRLELGKVVAFGQRKDKEQVDELLIFILHRGDLTDFINLSKEVARIISEQSGLEVSHIIPVKRIPKTTSGKIQRRLLGDAYINGEYDDVLAEITKLDESSHAGKEDDMTATEQQISDICKEVLADKVLHLDDDFFEAGISSLALAEIHQRIDDIYPDLLDIVDLFEYQTIRQVAAFMDKKKQETPG